MRRTRMVAAFVYDFVVGEDPLMFTIVIVGLGATATVQGLGVPSWWLLPLGVLLALGVSVLRVRSTT